MRTRPYLWWAGAILALVLVWPTPSHGQTTPTVSQVQFSFTKKPSKPQLTFQTTGPGTVQIYVNGQPAGQVQASSAGSHSITLPNAHWRGVGPQSVRLVTGPNSAYTTTVNKPWLLPRSRPNTRYFRDHFNIPRPALSVRGFDQSRLGNFAHNYSDKALAVRQVMERAYGIGQSVDPLVSQVYQKIIDQSRRKLDQGSTEDAKRDSNSAIFQAQGFLALFSYIRDINHISRRYKNEPPHVGVRDKIVATFRGPRVANRSMVRDPGWVDAPKMGKSLINIARCLDFYYALENAYQDLGGDLSKLLTRNQKRNVLRMMNDLMRKLHRYTHKDITYVLSVNLHEVQPGNWPMKGMAAVALVALGQNGPYYENSGGKKSRSYPKYEEYLSRGFQALVFDRYTTSPTRRNFWYYQSGEGKRFWAEGAYYFRWTLKEVIPFWHAMRANNMLSFSRHTSGTDPFFHRGFLNPIEWLADTAAPDGQTPALDDGNKTMIDPAGVLAWDSNYGDGTLGEKFANIVKRQGGHGYNRDLLVVEIAIPRTTVRRDLPRTVGNQTPQQTSEQQIVLRSDSGRRDHYLLLNGETHDSIARGEGHEQGDQLQLIYQVDGKTYLVDTGYDRVRFKGTKWIKSTWNSYRDHNVMTFRKSHGGIPAPKLNLWKKRVVSDHPSVRYLFYETKGRLRIAHGAVDLRMSSQTKGRYSRNIIFVDDPRTPYFIDINRIRHRKGHKRGHKYEMRYHGGSNQFAASRNSWVSWNTSALNLYAFIRPVEHAHPGLKVEKNYHIREKFGPTQPITKVRLEGQKVKYLTTMAIFQVASRRPSSTPQRLFTPSRSTYQPHQGWVWIQPSGAIDVILVRSIRERGNSARAFTVQIPRAGGYQLTLPKAKDFAFFRLRNIGGNWTVDRRYRFVGVRGRTN